MAAETMQPGGKDLVGMLVTVQRQAKLPDLVGTLASPRRFAGRLHRRQQERHQDADDRNDHQQLDQGEGTSG
jgi:hypothetical protein